MAIIKTTDKMCIGKDTEEQELSFTVGMQNGTAILEDNLAVPYKIKQLVYD